MTLKYYGEMNLNLKNYNIYEQREIPETITAYYRQRYINLIKLNFGIRSFYGEEVTLVEMFAI